MKKTYHLISETEFKRAKNALLRDKPRTGPNAIDIAYDHLVTGSTIPEIAEKFDCTTQHVRLRVRNLWVRYLQSKEIPAGWVKVDTYAPKEMADAFLAEIESQRESEYIIDQFDDDDVGDI